MSDNLSWFEQNKSIVAAIGAVAVGALALGYMMRGKGSDHGSERRKEIDAQEVK